MERIWKRIWNGNGKDVERNMEKDIKYSLSLFDIIKDVKNDKLTLPDFQRKYVWKKDSAINLIGSVLVKNPLGSLLVVKDAKGEDYSLKKIGTKLDVAIDEYNTTDLLLDGQQRITTLLLVFSNIIHQNANFKPCELSSNALKNRYFIKISKEKDEVFNIDSLEPLNLEDKLAGDIVDSIKVIQYVETKKEDFWYKPSPSIDWAKYRENIIRGDKDNYLIPLWLFSDNKYYNDVTELLISCAEVKHSANEIKIDKGKFKIWAKGIQDYFTDVLKNLKLLKYEYDDSKKEKAISAYEFLNKNGMPLTTFDLLVARVSSVLKKGKDNKNFRDLLDKQKKHLDTKFFKGNEYNKLFEKILPFCCKYDPEKHDIENKVTAGLFKETMALGLKGDEIKNNYKETQNLISSAIELFRNNFGIRKFSDITNKLMLDVVIGLYKIEGFSVSEDKLKAWYWLSCFGNRYGNKQNQTMINDINKLSTDDNFLNRLYETFEDDFYSSEYLLLQKEDQPSAKERNLINQYYLSIGYDSLLENSEVPRVEMKHSNDLEDHHIIPKKNDIPKNEYGANIADSPLNAILIHRNDHKPINNQMLHVQNGEYKYYSKVVNVETLRKVGFKPEKKGDIQYNIFDDVENLLSERYDSLKRDVINYVKSLLNSKSE